MARTYGRILTATWQDADWRDLPADAQHMYLLLVSQPDISPCGVLPFLPRRWAAMAGDLTEVDVQSRVTSLAAKRFVLLDEETGELAIRSYVRHDGGLTNVKMRGAIKNALVEIHSSVIRSAIEAEIPSEYRESIGLPPVDIYPGMPNRSAIEDRSKGHTIGNGEGEGAGVVVTDVPSPTPPAPQGGASDDRPPSNPRALGTNPRALGTNPRGEPKPKPAKQDPPRPSVEREFCDECGSSTGWTENDDGEAVHCPACNPPPLAEARAALRAAP